MDHALEAGDRLQAFHTNAPVLTPAAYEDFGRAVDTLLRLGRFDEAVLLWADCVEIQHFPPTINGRAGRGGLSACRVAPCVDMACLAEEGTSRSWGLLREQRNRQCLREVDVLSIRSGLDALDMLGLMRSTCFRATFTASS